MPSWQLGLGPTDELRLEVMPAEEEREEDLLLETWLTEEDFEEDLLLAELGGTQWQH